MKKAAACARHFTHPGVLKALEGCGLIMSTDSTAVMLLRRLWPEKAILLYGPAIPPGHHTVRHVWKCWKGEELGMDELLTLDDIIRIRAADPDPVEERVLNEILDMSVSRIIDAGVERLRRVLR